MTSPLDVIPCKFELFHNDIYKLFVPVNVFVSLYIDFYESNERFLLPVVYDSHDRILEFGSGMGTITSILARHCEFVLGLEALDEYAQVARANVEANELANVAILPVIGSTQDGEVQYHVRHPIYSSSLVPDRAGMELDTDEMRTIQTVDVNRIIAEYSINAIHLDVEGSERELIPHIINGPVADSIHKLSWEAHTHIIGKAANHVMCRAMVAAGFEIASIAGTREFPERAYTIAFARPPLAEEIRNRMHYGDSTGVKQDKFLKVLDEVEAQLQ